MGTINALTLTLRFDLPCAFAFRSELDDDSASDAGSVSDSGFSPIHGSSKGKGKSSNGRAGGRNGVEYSVLSIDQLMDVQKKEVDHVAGIIGIKVRFSPALFLPH